jgi:hypothetical protein
MYLRQEKQACAILNGPILRLASPYVYLNTICILQVTLVGFGLLIATSVRRSFEKLSLLRFHGNFNIVACFKIYCSTTISIAAVGKLLRIENTVLHS